MIFGDTISCQFCSLPQYGFSNYREWSFKVCGEGGAKDRRVLVTNDHYLPGVDVGGGDRGHNCTSYESV